MSKGTILLVEDDDIVARVIEWRLKNLGYSVCGCASSSQEAMDLIMKRVPDLVLMDINIKGDIDGIETARMIKQRISIPIVYLTSYSDEATLERVNETHPDGYVIKPFDDNQLRVAIDIALKKCASR
jgi:CheY-like chemotaxis protein